MHPTDLGVPGRCRPEIKVSYFRAREWLSIVQGGSRLFVIIMLDQGRNHVGNPTSTRPGSRDGMKHQGRTCFANSTSEVRTIERYQPLVSDDDRPRCAVDR